MAKDLILYIPSMWDSTFAPLLRRKGAASSMLGSQWNIRKRQLNVEETGLDDREYKKIRDDYSNGNIPVMVLPVAHCVQNMDRFNLAVIGPAIRTRNDIFVFRSKNISHPRCYLSREKLAFRIGVRESELTTSNISRIVFKHWSPDIFFFSNLEHSDLEQSDPTHKQLVKANRNLRSIFIRSYIRHVEVRNPKERLEKIIHGELDAALFMGEEMKLVTPFQRPELIDAANLNRMINNIYNVNMFPRAVFTIFRDEHNSASRMNVITKFFEWYNQQLEEMDMKPKRDMEERRIQALCRTGPLSDYQDIHTLIRFTEDIWDPMFEQDRDGYKLPNKRSLKPTDFIWWDQVTGVALSRMSDFLSELESTSTVDLFDTDRLNRELSHLEKVKLTILNQAKNKLDSDGKVFTANKLKEIIDYQSLTQDKKITLKHKIDELWKRKYGEDI